MSSYIYHPISQISATVGTGYKNGSGITQNGGVFGFEEMCSSEVAVIFHRESQEYSNQIMEKIKS